MTKLPASPLQAIGARPGRVLLAALPYGLLAVEPVLVALWLAPLGPRCDLIAVCLPVAAALAFDWPASLRARSLGAVMLSFTIAVACGAAILSGLADLAGFGTIGARHLAGAAASLIVLRLVLCGACRHARARGWAGERVAILGHGLARGLLARRLATHAVGLAGSFDATPGGIASLLRLARAEPLDRVLLAFPVLANPQALRAVLGQLRTIDVRVEGCDAERLAPTGRDGLPRSPDPFAGMELVLLAGRPISAQGLALKAAADKLLSLSLLVLIAPAMVLVAVAIRCDSAGPVLFRQAREGRHGAEFDILKFRTMIWRGGVQAHGVLQTARGDARVTRLGRILRATSLDELPQLFNVLRGDMSLVGPRPHPQAMITEDRLSADIDADYPHRHLVRPGMTGWAQVNGSRGGLRSSEELCQRLRYDLHYIDNWSLLLDLRIALLTPFKMVFHDGAAF